jgi:hypothetical protein
MLVFLPALIVERVDEIQNSTDSHKSLLRLGDLVRLEFQSNHFSFLIKHNGSESRLLARRRRRSSPSPGTRRRGLQMPLPRHSVAGPWPARGCPIRPRVLVIIRDVPSESDGCDSDSACGGCSGPAGWPGAALALRLSPVTGDAVTVARRREESRVRVTIVT